MIETLKDLSPDPKNPRKIKDSKLKQLDKTLKEFGDLSGIIFNRRTGTLVSGHQRLKVLPPESKIVLTKAYADPTQAGTVAEGQILIGEEAFKYREVDWDDAKSKAALIAANKNAGEWDLPTLKASLLELDTGFEKFEAFDMDLTGFDHIEIADLLADVKHSEPKSQKLCPHCGLDIKAKKE